MGQTRNRPPRGCRLEGTYYVEMAFVEGIGNDAEDRDSLYLVGLDMCPLGSRRR
jgi:hypothetical protein